MASRYVELWASGELRARAEKAAEVLRNCTLCPRRCGVDRTRGQMGFCRSGRLPVVASYNRHLGEEPPISGVRGSGTIFLSHCNLHCVFCQNYPISQLGVGRERSSEELAGMMLDLQKRGCHNINWVTPTHFVPQIIAALCLAADAGLRIPMVYNTNGYDSVETLQLLDGVVDVYLPDMKYADEETARAYSQAPGYPAVNARAIMEMYRQVGEGLLTVDGMMERGMIIRHLLLPNGLAGTEKVARFIAEKVPGRCSISLMTQFFPAYRARGFPQLKRRLYRREFAEALRALDRVGLDLGWLQEVAKN